MNTEELMNPSPQSEQTQDNGENSPTPTDTKSDYMFLPPYVNHPGCGY